MSITSPKAACEFLHSEILKCKVNMRFGVSTVKNDIIATNKYYICSVLRIVAPVAINQTQNGSPVNPIWNE
jgi:hypothetical protein